MNQSPNSLRNDLRLQNADLSSLNVIVYNDTHYVTESNLTSFIESTGIDSKEAIISAFCEEFNLNGLEILRPNNEDTDLNDLYDFVSVYESIDPIEIKKVSDGPNQLKMFLDKAVAFVLNKEYDSVSEIEKEIAKCDRALEDIKDERKVANDNKHNSSYKFKLTYIFNIAKTIFEQFVFSKLITKSLKPEVIAKITRNKKLKTLVDAVSNISKFTNKKGINATVKIAELVDAGVPEDIKGIYLSFADYNGLLDYYEKKIEYVKRDLEFKLESAKHEAKEEKKAMIELKEDFADGSAVSVHYVSPEDLKAKEIKHVDVLHSDDIPEGDKQQVAEPAPAPEIPTPSEKPIVGEPAPAEFNPAAAINKAYGEPANVLVTKYDDKYYINHSDIDRYMQNSDAKDYDTAVDHIVKANDDPELTPDSVKIVMRQSELDSCDVAKQAKLEAALVEFEVYPD